MKHFISLLAIICCLVSVAATNGCKQPATNIPYQTVATSKVTVETAMRLWGAWVGAGKATVQQEIAVRDAYRKYQVAMVAVCDAGAIYQASVVTNSTGATGASAALQQAIVTAGQCLTDLQNLIASFGVKLN